MTIKMVDKSIHKNEFKLRLLLTNGCNRNCKFCLNDFQSKPIRNPKYISKYTVQKATTAYKEETKGQFPIQIYLSGGEPLSHPLAHEITILTKAYDKETRTTLCTNGDFLSTSPHFNIRNHIDCLHISAYSKDPNTRDKAVKLNADIQCVHSTSNPYVDIEFLKYYLDVGLRVKVFQDFFDNGSDYMDFINEVNHKLPKSPISYRHTGVQENRGKGCSGCDKKCITLKALWVFPDGGTTPCPQSNKREYPVYTTEWNTVMKQAIEFHKTS